jgi:hypothetical protein
MKALHMVSDCGDMSFVLVKNDIVHVSVVNYIVCFKPVFNDQCTQLEETTD